VNIECQSKNNFSPNGIEKGDILPASQQQALKFL
jgi:hypothetical protein